MPTTQFRTDTFAIIWFYFISFYIFKYDDNTINASLYKYKTVKCAKKRELTTKSHKTFGIQFSKRVRIEIFSVQSAMHCKIKFSIEGISTILIESHY